MKIFPLFILSLLNLTIIADCCNPTSCARNKNSSRYSEGVLVNYPFRVIGVQPESCGVAGFELHCDPIAGPRIELPNSVSFTVDDISYYSQRIILSDQDDDCLPQKLLSLNLTKTRFRPAWTTTNFWVYNCSGKDEDSFIYQNGVVDYRYGLYDLIDCLSGSNYSVRSATSDVTNEMSRWNCSFVKVLSVPIYYYSTAPLSGIFAINLSWDDGNDSASKSPVGGVVIGILVIVVGIGLCCFCICRLRRNYTLNSINNATQRSRGTESTTAGLDQVTIDSYPRMVVGESGRLIKPGDETCSICLSDYRSHETIKMLPRCLHRFHADCIDQWLRSKAICPVCRTAPRRVDS